MEWSLNLLVRKNKIMNENYTKEELDGVAKELWDGCVENGWDEKVCCNHLAKVKELQTLNGIWIKLSPNCRLPEVGQWVLTKCKTRFTWLRREACGLWYNEHRTIIQVDYWLDAPPSPLQQPHWHLVSDDLPGKGEPFAAILEIIGETKVDIYKAGVANPELVFGESYYTHWHPLSPLPKQESEAERCLADFGRTNGSESSNPMKPIDLVKFAIDWARRKPSNDTGS